MANIASPATGRPTLLTSEDWWAIWLGGLLIAITVFGLVTTVPSVGRWTGDPGAAFEGRLIGLMTLGLGLTLVTGVAARIMGGVAHLSVPLTVDTGAGPNGDEAH